MEEEKLNKCLKDDKRCYIHHDKETGFEIRCRYFDLTLTAGVCPPTEEIDKCGEKEDEKNNGC